MKLGASDPLIGVIGAAGGATYALMARLFGYISDRFSKRLLAGLALLLQTAGILLFTFIRLPEFLGFARAVHATGSALFWPVVEALVADLAPPGQLDKSLKGYNLAWGTGSIIGPQIGGLLISLYSVLMPFYLSSATCLLVLPLLLLTRAPRIALSGQGSSQKGRENDVRAKLSNHAYGALASGSLYSFNYSLVSALFPASATRLGIQAYEIGALFLLSGLAQTIVFAQADKIESRIGLRTSLVSGSCIFLFSLLTIPLTSNLTILAFSFSAQGVASGVLYATSLSLLIKESSPRHGRATGLWESTMGTGFFAGPLLGGVVAGLSSTAPYLLAAFGCAFTVPVQLRLLHQGGEKNRHPRPHPPST